MGHGGTEAEVGKVHAGIQLESVFRPQSRNIENTTAEMWIVTLCELVNCSMQDVKFLKTRPEMSDIPTY